MSKFIIIFIILIINPIIVLGSYESGSIKKFNILGKNIDNNDNIHGSIPYIENFYKKYVQQQINNNIDNIHTYIATLYGYKYNSIYFDYDYKEYKDFSSIIIYIKIVNGLDADKKIVKTLNFNNKTGEILKLNSVIDKEYLDNIGINNFSMDGYFYFDNGKVYVVDDSYYFEINLTNIKSCVIPIEDTYTTNGVVMVPLKRCIEELYYPVEMINNNGLVEISNENIKLYFKINEDRFLFNNKFKQLEMKSEVKDNILYVPISFFELVLGGYYKYDNNNYNLFIFNE